MRAVRLTEPGRPLELQEIPVPEPGPTDVLVRVAAAGICRSDVHYRAGTPRIGPLPMTLGHEVAGAVAATGSDLAEPAAGTRVCVHYQIGCGTCRYCTAGTEQFCPTGAMIGNGRDGGYAEFIAVPARNVFVLPDEIPLEHGAVMMCSSATSLHALHKGRLRRGETVAVFGAGGLGMSAIQLAGALGAATVFAVDVDPGRLDLAGRLGAIPVDASRDDPVAAVHRATGDGGADVALELVGSAAIMRQAIDVLGPLGRAVAVGLTPDTVAVGPYTDLVGREAEIIGVSDHLASEIPLLIEMAATGRLDLTDVVTGSVPLDAAAVNAALDHLEAFGAGVRTVIEP